MLPPRIPTILLNNGHRIPIIGLGTWLSKPGEVYKAVRSAIDVGYRHIDCALFYGNEHEIGIGIHDRLINNAVQRKDLFITGKLWNTFHKPNLVMPSCMKTIKDLKTKYLDLYLIHWPMAYKEGGALIPMKNKKVLYSDVHYLDTWKAMEELVDNELVKSIGVANFNINQLGNVIRHARIKPVMCQVECHPYLNQKDIMKYCKSHDIRITCYSPLGSPRRPWAKKDEPVVLEDPTILALAQRYTKTPAQIILRYQIQRGNIVIPKSITPSRIKQNLEIFDFQLTCNDLQEISALNRGVRYVALKGDSKHPHYPFERTYSAKEKGKKGKTDKNPSAKKDASKKKDKGKKDKKGEKDKKGGKDNKCKN